MNAIRRSWPGWVLAGILGSASLAQTPAPERPLIFGINPVAGDWVARHGGNASPYRDLVWQKLAEVGSRACRVLASWREIEHEPGQWNWADLDYEIRQCERYGIEPIVLIVNIPGWVSPTGKDTHAYPPREDKAEQFNEFITRLAQRYKGKAKFYEFWNEENGCGWHFDKGFNMAHEYVPWLYRCYKAIKRVDPEAQVAIGGLDDAEGHAPIFVRKCYKLRKEKYNGEKFWDAIATHPYSYDVETALKKLDAIRKIAAENGDKGIPLWITEFGWHTAGMSWRDQARKTHDFLTAFSRPDQADLQICTFLALGDFERLDEGFGFCDVNLRPKPSFRAFQQLARAGQKYVLAAALVPAGPGRLTVRGRLSEPCAGRVVLYDAQGTPGRQQPFHSFSESLAVSYENLEPGLYRAQIFLDGQRLPHVPHEVVGWLPAPQTVANGNFEGGFAAGIAHGWRIRGRAIARQSAIDSGQPHAGQWAQALLVLARAKHRRFDDQLTARALLNAKKPVRIECSAILIGPDEHKPDVQIRLGLLGAKDAGQWTTLSRAWRRYRGQARPATLSPEVRIHVRCDRLPDKTEWTVLIDDVTITPTD